jgi:transmembrane sensor
MNGARENERLAEATDTRLEQATEWFRRVRSESARVEDLPEFRRWMEADPLNALAYREVTETWATLGKFASAPEIVVGRRDALDDARRAARRRWSARRRFSSYAALAASVVIAIVGIFAWIHTQRGIYATDVGERTTLTLQDGSVVTLDARSRIRVQYQENERLIDLEHGQARFDVAKDPTRPFRVRARDQTVIALGTQFNVEIVADNVLVSMIEGHVAITGAESRGWKPAPDRSAPGRAVEQPVPGTAEQAPVIELRAGEGLRVGGDGHAVVVSKIDLDRATAWQSGKLFFDNEPLANAAERVNRYSKLQIEVDPSVADVGVSGVFNAGDSNAFIEAISTYFSVQVTRTGSSEIHLTARN